MIGWAAAGVAALIMVAFGIFTAVRVVVIITESVIGLARRMLRMQHSDLMVGSIPMKQFRRQVREGKRRWWMP
jgi:hypothetical protein